MHGTAGITPDQASVSDRPSLPFFLALLLSWAPSAAFSVLLAILSINEKILLVVIGANILSLLASFAVAFRQRRLAFVVAYLPSILLVSFLVVFAWWVTRTGG